MSADRGTYNSGRLRNNLHEHRRNSLPHAGGARHDRHAAVLNFQLHAPHIFNADTLAAVLERTGNTSIRLRVDHIFHRQQRLLQRGPLIGKLPV